MSAVTVVVGGARDARANAVRTEIDRHGGHAHVLPAAAEWPFRANLTTALPASGPCVLSAADLHDAFPPGQAGSTRLVLTQSTYLLQVWLDVLDTRGDIALVADASRTALARSAPEAFARRGPWSRIELVDLGPDTDADPEPSPHPNLLVQAFRTADPADRLTLCRRAEQAHPDDPVVLLALGSAYMEVQDLDAAEVAIRGAVRSTPAWAAAYFEYGKLQLRRDDMERARDAFRTAGELMPTLSAAFSNLGATLGELDQTDEALAAFRQALTFDPEGFSVWNNVGVLCRELGRLDESEEALRKVVALAPDFVFGHYNLGHTLFLQGRFQEALTAYTEGQRRDPQKNPRQACRLAVAKAAAGDPDGAWRDLQNYTAHLPRDLKRDLLAEAQSNLLALTSLKDRQFDGLFRVIASLQGQLASLG